MKRGRRSTTGLKEGAWRARHRELLARDSGRLPPISDLRELPPEWQQLFSDLRQLPRLKYRRARDREVWGWVYVLLVRQHQGAPYDLRTCKLGANPANPNAQPSKVLRLLTATVAQEYPGVDAARLFDAIRHWRKSVSTIAP